MSVSIISNTFRVTVPATEFASEITFLNMYANLNTESISLEFVDVDGKDLQSVEMKGATYWTFTFQNCTNMRHFFLSLAEKIECKFLIIRSMNIDESYQCTLPFKKITNLIIEDSAVNALAISHFPKTLTRIEYTLPESDCSQLDCSQLDCSQLGCEKCKDLTRSFFEHLPQVNLTSMKIMLSCLDFDRVDFDFSSVKTLELVSDCSLSKRIDKNLTTLFPNLMRVTIKMVKKYEVEPGVRLNFKSDVFVVVTGEVSEDSYKTIDDIVKNSQQRQVFFSK